MDISKIDNYLTEGGSSPEIKKFHKIRDIYGKTVDKAYKKAIKELDTLIYSMTDIDDMRNVYNTLDFSEDFDDTLGGMLADRAEKLGGNIEG